MHCAAKNINLTKSLTQYFILPKHCCLFPYNNGKKAYSLETLPFFCSLLSKFFQPVTVLKQRNDQITCLQSKQMRFIYSNQFMLNDQAKLYSFSLFTHRHTQMQMSGVKHDLEESHPLYQLSVHGLQTKTMVRAPALKKPDSSHEQHLSVPVKHQSARVN